MLHFAAFHLGLHCLPKYLFRGSLLLFIGFIIIMKDGNYVQN